MVSTFLYFYRGFSFLLLPSPYILWDRLKTENLCNKVHPGSWQTAWALPTNEKICEWAEGLIKNKQEVAGSGEKDQSKSPCTVEGGESSGICWCVQSPAVSRGHIFVAQGRRNWRTRTGRGLGPQPTPVVLESVDVSTLENSSSVSITTIPPSQG